MKPAAIGIIFRKNQTEVLLVCRKDVGVWVLPGGGIEPGELPESAVIREVLEETGLKAVIRRKVGEYTPLNRLAHFTHLFECDILAGELQTGEETRDLQFFPTSQLPFLFFPLHRDWLEDALKNDPQVIRKPITRITYFEAFRYFIKHPWMIFRYLMTRLFCK